MAQQRTNDKDQAFKDWLGQVNRLCLAKFHIGLSDLPDMLTRDAFDGGTSPEEFFEDDVMNMAREEFGDLVDEL